MDIEYSTKLQNPQPADRYNPWQEPDRCINVVGRLWFVMAMIQVVIAGSFARQQLSSGYNPVVVGRLAIFCTHRKIGLTSWRITHVIEWNGRSNHQMVPALQCASLHWLLQQPVMAWRWPLPHSRGPPTLAVRHRFKGFPVTKGRAKLREVVLSSLVIPMKTSETRVILDPTHHW